MWQSDDNTDLDLDDVCRTRYMNIVPSPKKRIKDNGYTTAKNLLIQEG